jgi:molybdate transport system ATP-binding protein
MVGAVMSFEVDIEIRRGAMPISVAFDAPNGLTALFGRSGIGKTTTLDVIAGLLTPGRGRVVVGGDVLFDSAERVDVAPERRACGYVFQDGRLFPHRTVRDNLLYGWRLRKPEQRWMALGEAVDFLGIGDLLGRMPRTLSGGEAQRVAIGRALLSGPRFLLMDEPLSSLDAPRREEIMAVVERIRDELRLPILYVSHERAEVERLADRVIDLDSL